MNNITVKKGTDTSEGTGTVQPVKFKNPDSAKSSLPNTISYKDADYATRGEGRERGVTASYSYDMYSKYTNVYVVPQARVRYAIYPIPYGGSWPVTLYGWTNTAYVNHTINSQ